MRLCFLVKNKKISGNECLMIYMYIFPSSQTMLDKYLSVLGYISPKLVGNSASTLKCFDCISITSILARNIFKVKPIFNNITFNCNYFQSKYFCNIFIALQKFIMWSQYLNNISISLKAFPMTAILSTNITYITNIDLILGSLSLCH